MAGSFGDPGRSWWIAHGVLMIIAWGFCIPVGTTLAVYRRYVGKNGKILKKEPSFYPWHRNLQTFGVILTFVAFAMGVKGSQAVYGTGNPFNKDLWNFTNDQISWNRHVKIGFSVLVICVVQSILGMAAHVMKDRHGNPATWKRPIVPSWAHVVIGVGCMCVAYIAMYQGLQIFDYIFDSTQVNPGVKVGYFFVTLSMCVFVLMYVVEKVRGAVAAPPPKQEPEDDKMETVDPEEAAVEREEAAVNPTPSNQMPVEPSDRTMVA